MAEPVVQRAGEIPIRAEQDIVLARQLVRKLVIDASFSVVDQTKMVTAASELARNTLVYGGGGSMHWESLVDGLKRGVRVTFIDQGPGIPDLDQAMTDGWTSGNGLGLGLSGSKRLVNQFEIVSQPGQGTTVAITHWK